ncbi:MAG: methylenetetrahydrofolate reductase C-terminal domain-containing protein [Alsobacter sp.]
MLTPTAFEPRGKRPPKADAFRMRFVSIRHSRFMEKLYDVFEPTIASLHPLFKAIGYERAERPVAALEKAIKGALFDCRMCGQCILSSTGMSCPMNCPKSLRNGPCGGVRANGNCEVYPDMPCVWVKAWEGSRAMIKGDRIAEVQPPVDHRRKGESSWLGVVREKAGDAPQAPAKKH